MSPQHLPILKPKRWIRLLDRLGFLLIRKSKGSHWQYEHPDGRRTTIPVHAGSDIGPGLARKIIRDIEIDVEELRKWL